jgi:hypothetical protein
MEVDWIQESEEQRMTEPIIEPASNITAEHMSVLDKSAEIQPRESLSTRQLPMHE